MSTKAVLREMLYQILILIFENLPYISYTSTFTSAWLHKTHLGEHVNNFIHSNIFIMSLTCTLDMGMQQLTKQSLAHVEITLSVGRQVINT